MRSSLRIWGREIAAAVITGALATVAAVVAFRISPSDLTKRWTAGSDDQILHYMAATDATHGFLYLPDSLLGFPHAQDLFFAPIFDFASSIEMALLSLVIHDGILLLNVFYLVGFFVAAVCGYAALRILGVRVLISATFAIVFALAPYHFQRVAMGHGFVANYGGVAFVAVAIAVVMGLDTPFGRWMAAAGSRASRVRRGVATAVIVTAPIAATLNYYYVFAILILIGMLLFRLVGNLLAGRRLRGMVWPTATVGSLMILSGVQLLLLAQGFGERYANYFSVRGIVESELYGGKITTLLLPWQGSSVPVLGNLARNYLSQSGFLVTSEPPGTPLIAAIAMIAMVLLLILRALPSPLPTWVRDPRLGALSAGFLWSLLFFLAGGLGALFTLTVTGDIRAWSRLSIVMIFLALAFAAVLLDRLLTATLARIIVVVVLLAVMVVDQLWGVARNLPLAPTDDASLRQFVSQVDDLTPDGCGIVELPLMSFPESPRIHGVTDYVPALPFLYSGDAVRWSYGAVRGTYAADYWEDVHSTAQFAAKYGASGACGIVVDTHGYRGAGWSAYVSAVTSGVPAARSEGDGGRYLFFGSR
jgi:hypothetical protein